MVTVFVGSSQRPLEEAVIGGWIEEQFRRQGGDKSAICFSVVIKEQGIDLRLSTPSCGGGGGSSRPLTQAEDRIVELWRKRGLSDQNTTPGEVQAFLRQLSQLL
jgi:hypothetical protein